MVGNDSQNGIKTEVSEVWGARYTIFLQELGFESFKEITHVRDVR